MKKLWCPMLLALFALNATLMAAQKIEVLYTFAGGADGANPFGGVILDSAGNAYGTTESGGDLSCNNIGCGTVFKIDSRGTKTILHSFHGSDGAGPRATLVRDAAGNLYGTTFFGGTFSCRVPEGCGVVFKIDTANQFSVVHRFGNMPDGANPWGGLVADAKGNLYGTTTQGGTSNATIVVGCGTVYKIDSAGRETVLYAFTCGADGAAPDDTPFLDSKGNLYGTTIVGGDLSCYSGLGCGTVFKLDTTGKESVVYAFKSSPDAGAPQASLNYVGGSFYSTSSVGGSHAAGTVFKVDTSGNESVFYSFGSNSKDGEFPISGLTHDSQGNLYGTTGIIHSTIFKLDPAGHETLLYVFGSDGTGLSPNAGLTRDSAGNLYGTASTGNTASSRYGTVFKLIP